MRRDLFEAFATGSSRAFVDLPRMFRRVPPPFHLQDFRPERPGLEDQMSTDRWNRDDRAEVIQ